MSDDHMRKGDQLMEEAGKASSGGGGFLGGLFGGGSRKKEDAAETFLRAANAYKMGKHWEKAAQAFLKAAELHKAMGSKHDAATNFVDAANCYRKVNGNSAVQCLSSSIEIYTDMGRFTIAAKHHMSIGEIYENELQEPEKAMAEFEKAADYFKGEESNSSAYKCLGRVAHLAAAALDFVKGARIFEELGKSAMENSLLKYGAKDHFFRASLCHMNIDVLNCQQAIGRYVDMNPSFADSREYKLLLKLVEAANPEEPDADAFTQAIVDYDSISRLDPWSTKLLNNVKKTLKADEPELT